MIDIKATIENNGLSQYRVAKIIGRKPVQVWRWYHGIRGVSPAVEKEIIPLLEAEDITVYEKD